ncbi:MAG: ABC transporter substrate-binding protein [Chloroflexi bacterium]|nr:ABC transporter substrate-binding protein [Chloroflexota bacterium]
MAKSHVTAGILVLASALLLGTLGCAAPAPTPTPTKPPAAAPTKPPAAAPTQPPAAPTKAPAAAAPPAKPTPAPAKVADPPLSPPVQVKVGVLGSVVDAGFFISADRGYFKELGLDVELVNFQTAALMNAPMGTGQLDVGAGGVSAGLFNLIAREVPVRIVADKSHAEPGNKSVGFLVRKDLMDSGAIKTPADLKGRTFALASRGTTSEHEVEVLLGQGGLTINDVEIKLMGYPDMIIAFANKAIDIAYAFEPNVTTAIDKGVAAMWKLSYEIIPNHEPSVVLYAPSFIDKKLEAARRFMVAYIKGVRDYNDALVKNIGKDAVITILTKYSTQKDPEVLKKLNPQPINPDGYVYPESIQKDMDFFVKRGDVKDPVNLKEAIDNRYVDYAIEKLGRYQK